MTNSCDNTDPLLLMKTVQYSQKLQNKNLRLEYSSLITKVRSIHGIRHIIVFSLTLHIPEACISLNKILT